MSAQALRPCAESGCPELVRDASRCKPDRQKRERARGSRQERGYGVAHERWRRAVLRRDRGLCQPCRRKGRASPGTQADHIVPFDRGGARLDLENGQAICTSCHGLKTAWERDHDDPWPEAEARR